MISHCYPMNIDTPSPVFNNGLKIWEWKNYQGDWAYPFTVDGSIYRTSDFIDTIKVRPFDHPGSFENALLTSIPDRPKMICFDESKIINIPANRVGPYPNRHGNESHYHMNQQYLSGQQISLKTFIGFKNISCHQEIPFEWELA